MKARLAALTAFATFLILSGGRPAFARDDRLKMPIKVALERPEAQKKLDPEIRLYFANAPHPTPEADLGDYRIDKKTRSVGRSDASACELAFLSALIALQQHARSVGANAVVGITSFYKDDTLTSDTEYLCGAGSMVAGTGLSGKSVRLPAKK